MGHWGAVLRDGARLIGGGACTPTSRCRTRTTRDTAQEVRQVRPARDRRVTAEQARRPVQGDVPRAHGAVLRFVLDRLLYAVQAEGLARQAGRRASRRGDHGQDRARHRLAGDGGCQHARHIRLTVPNGHRRYRFTIPPVLSRYIRGTETRK